MGQYGEAAVRAARYCIEGDAQSPKEAWSRAISELSSSTESRRKSCPKDAFLGLCEAGLVCGIPAGDHGAPAGNKNGRYAVDACEILQSNPVLLGDRKALWNSVSRPRPENQNGQLEVVIALWKAGLIQKHR